MSFSTGILTVWNVIRTLIDICLVWAMIFLAIRMFRQNIRTLQLFKGVVFVLLLKFITSVVGLTTMDYLVDLVLSWGILAIIIIFQPELRALLEKLGQTKLDHGMSKISKSEKDRLVDELVDAISEMSDDKTGALITFEMSQSLDEYIQKGIKINADIKSELFTTIFWEGTPLHDGATIIKNGRVVCAATFYPTTKQELSTNYGARHRAALGISEATDALTVVVSEETGTISFAKKGVLQVIPKKELKASLVNELDWFNSDKEGE